MIYAPVYNTAILAPDGGGSLQQSFQFQLFADYYQFYLQDESATTDLSASWTPEAVDRLLAMAPEMVGVGTARNMNVPVTVEVRDYAPDEDTSGWDQVNECTLEVPSGRIVVAGCTDYVPDAARIEVAPGSYRVRVYCGNLTALSRNGLEGDDHYKILLWAAAPGPLRVLKQRNTPAAKQ